MGGWRIGEVEAGDVRDAFFLDELGDGVERLLRPLADATLDLDALVSRAPK